MGCCGQARWKREEVPDHKFDFIDVRDYWSNGYLTRIKYAFLFANMAKSIAVYIADIYTAITLLAFHHFNGNIYNRVADSPTNTVRVPFDYGKWIFTGCIIFSFLLLAYEAHKARAVIRSRDISYAYTNIMANDYYSIRSYNHFCFFCQINNSKKKKDELAFFIFFTFKGWKRLLVADGPRQVINALTLYALAEASNFSTNIEDYYEGNVFTLIMLITMLFTVLVFAGSAILLIVAAVLYLPLVCYIQGNLKEYCCHKIDKRISELVQKKKKQRLGKYAAIARAEAAGDFSHLMNKKGIIVGRKMVQPTLPQLDVNLLDEDPKSIKKNLDRKGSFSSSTAHSGYYGAESTMYHLKGEEFGSTAQLMTNQGYAGSNISHGYGNNALVSLPPSVHNSPDSYPAQVRGLQGTQDVLRSQSNTALLAQMGPIGSSPDMFAQRVVGRTSPFNGEPNEKDERNSPSMGAYRVQGTAKSPLGPQGVSQQAQQENHGYYSNQNGHDIQQHDSTAYSNTGLHYPPSTQSQGVNGAEYPPPSRRQSHQINVQPPDDLSAYAPYQQDDHDANYLASPEGEDRNANADRPHSFSDVYEAYYHDHDEQDTPSDRGSSYQRGSVQQSQGRQLATPQDYQQSTEWLAEDQRHADGSHENGYALSRYPSNGGYNQHAANNSYNNDNNNASLHQTQRGASDYQNHNARMYNYQSR